MCFHLLERFQSSSLAHNSLFFIWLFQALTVFSSFLREAWNIFLSHLCACAAWVTGQVIKKLLTSDSATVHLFCFNINSPSVALWHPLSNFCTLFSIRNMASVCSCLLIIFFCLDFPWLVLMSASDFPLLSHISTSYEAVRSQMALLSLPEHSFSATSLLLLFFNSAAVCNVFHLSSSQHNICIFFPIYP